MQKYAPPILAASCALYSTSTLAAPVPVSSTTSLPMIAPSGRVGVKAARGPHRNGDGFDFPIARVVVGLPLSGGAKQSGHIGLRDAHAAIDFQQVTVDADAREVAPSHYLGLSQCHAGESGRN